jgi:hypothetical protein
MRTIGEPGLLNGGSSRSSAPTDKLPSLTVECTSRELLVRFSYWGASPSAPSCSGSGVGLGVSRPISWRPARISIDLLAKLIDRAGSTSGALSLDWPSSN